MPVKEIWIVAPGQYGPAGVTVGLASINSPQVIKAAVATTGKVILEGLGNTLGSHLRGSRIPIDKIKNQALYIISITD